MDADLLFGNEVDLKLQFFARAPRERTTGGEELPALLNRKNLGLSIRQDGFCAEYVEAIDLKSPVATKLGAYQ
jgi:hypothetical protein